MAVTVWVLDTVAPLAGVVICVTGGVISVPVPKRILVCKPPLSLTERTADLAPLAAGVNVTLMVQLALAPKDVPQLSDSVKSPVFVPVKEILMPVSEAPLPLERVNACAVLELPTPTLPKL